eukprot:2560735-Pyramimonas_sp.AAC.2
MCTILSVNTRRGFFGGVTKLASGASSCQGRAPRGFALKPPPLSPEGTNSNRLQLSDVDSDRRELGG